MFKKFGLYILWVVVTLATVASLLAPDFMCIPVCSLCWYQRICLFPLSVILGIAAWHGFYPITTYVLPQSIVGFCLAINQCLIEKFPYWDWLFWLPSSATCIEPAYIGIASITAPMLSALLFMFISVFLIVFKYISEKGKQ